MAASELFSGRSSLDKDHPFRDAAVSFAIDVSTSTTGRTLDMERTFIKKIADLLSPASQLNARVLPWSAVAQAPETLWGLRNLRNSFGTMPHKVLQDARHLNALYNSSLWFLMTDGIVTKEDGIEFARQLASKSMHGTSCVTVIFGSIQKQPASCNISVGVNVYSVSPNCLFLYCDTASGELMIMGSKGIFTSVLKGAVVPEITAGTTWMSLPRLSFKSFSDIVMPPAKRLGKDQIALQDSLVINLDDLLKNKLSEDKVNQIFSNNDNVDALITTTSSRGQQEKFGAWVKSQERTQERNFKGSSGNRPFEGERRDDSGARGHMKRLVSRDSDDLEEERETTRGRLRRANARNMGDYLTTCQEERQAYDHRRMQMQQSAAKSSGTQVHSARTLNSYMGGGFGGGSSGPTIPPRPSSGARKSERWGEWKREITDPALKHVLYTKGFSSERGAFRGTCALCGADDMVLALLFRQTPAASKAALLREQPPLAFGPLCAVDGRPVCRSLVCDPCSSNLAASALPSPDGDDKVLAALPLVRYDPHANAAYLGVLRAVFAADLAATVLLRALASVVLDEWVGMRLQPAATAAGDGVRRHDALRWLAEDLLPHVTPPKRGYFDGSATKLTLPVRARESADEKPEPSPAFASRTLRSDAMAWATSSPTGIAALLPYPPGGPEAKTRSQQQQRKLQLQQIQMQAATQAAQIQALALQQQQQGGASHAPPGPAAPRNMVPDGPLGFPAALRAFLCNPRASTGDGVPTPATAASPAEFATLLRAGQALNNNNTGAGVSTARGAEIAAWWNIMALLVRNAAALLGQGKGTDIAAVLDGLLWTEAGGKGKGKDKAHVAHEVAMDQDQDQDFVFVDRVSVASGADRAPESTTNQSQRQPVLAVWPRDLPRTGLLDFTGHGSPFPAVVDGDGTDDVVVASLPRYVGSTREFHIIFSPPAGAAPCSSSSRQCSPWIAAATAAFLHALAAAVLREQQRCVVATAASSAAAAAVRPVVGESDLFVAAAARDALKPLREDAAAAGADADVVRTMVLGLGDA